MQTMQTDNFVNSWLAALVLLGKKQIDMVQEMPYGMARMINYISTASTDKSIASCQTSFELLRLAGVLSPSSNMGLSGGLPAYVNGSKSVAVADRWNCGVLDILLTPDKAALQLDQVPREWRAIVENCARTFRGLPPQPLVAPSACAFMPPREQPGWGGQ